MSLKRFSLRDLMLLTAFVALALAWWGERRNQSVAATRYQLHVNGERASVIDSAADQVTLFSSRANPGAAIDNGITLPSSMPHR